jgi:hypothetical protein
MSGVADRFYIVLGSEGETLAGPCEDERDAIEQATLDDDEVPPTIVRDVTAVAHEECRAVEAWLAERAEEAMPGDVEDRATIRHRLAEILAVQVRDA